MPVFKTTQEIFKNPWKEFQETETLPIRREWLKDKSIELADIETWEQIYFCPGNLGIYAAWSPYAEIYMIYYNLLGTYEIYSGERAGIKMFQHARSLGIDLPINNLWVPFDDPLLQEPRLTPFQ